MGVYENVSRDTVMEDITGKFVKVQGTHQEGERCQMPPFRARTRERRAT